MVTGCKQSGLRTSPENVCSWLITISQEENNLHRSSPLNHLELHHFQLSIRAKILQRFIETL